MIKKRLEKNNVVLHELINKTMFINYNKYQEMYVQKLNEKLTKDSKARYAARLTKIDLDHIKYIM
jgi:superoxide dismutase